MRCNETHHLSTDPSPSLLIVSIISIMMTDLNSISYPCLIQLVGSADASSFPVVNMGWNLTLALPSLSHFPLRSTPSPMWWQNLIADSEATCSTLTNFASILLTLHFSSVQRGLETLAATWCCSWCINPRRVSPLVCSTWWQFDLYY